MDVDLPKILKRCLSASVIDTTKFDHHHHHHSQQLQQNQHTNQMKISTTKSNLTIGSLPSMSSSLNAAIAATTITATTTATATSSGGVGMTSTITSTNSSSSREASPAPMMNIFTPRARRYSASFASIGAANLNNSGPCLTPRVSQLRQEECIDINSREVNHEREVHSAMQMSQSWEDLSLVAENWSCKSDDLSNPLQVTLPSGAISCSSPSPTSRTGMRLPYGLSPSPTRRTFATRRSMSPIAMRPSQLGPVKRKFELDDNNTNIYSPPPLKKIFTESRGSSPICQSPSSICASPDSGTYDGRITPKLFVSKLNTNMNTNSSSPSLCLSPMMVPSPVTDVGIDLQSNNSSSSANTISSTSNEPNCINTFDVDIDDNDNDNELKANIVDEMKSSSFSNNPFIAVDDVTITNQPNNNVIMGSGNIEIAQTTYNNNQQLLLPSSSTTVDCMFDESRGECNRGAVNTIHKENSFKNLLLLSNVSSSSSSSSSNSNRYSQDNVLSTTTTNNDESNSKYTTTGMINDV